jgi:hypothetical protein
VPCGDGSIDVKGGEISERKSIENKGFSKMRCNFWLFQVGENPCKINMWEHIQPKS